MLISSLWRHVALPAPTIASDSCCSCELWGDNAAEPSREGTCKELPFSPYTSSPADVRSVRGVSACRTCDFLDNACYMESSNVINPNFGGEGAGGLAHGQDFQFVRLSGLVCFS